MSNMFGMNLKYLRDKSNLSQEQFAEKLGVSRQTIAKWENGDSLPDIERGTEIAAMFSVSLEALTTCSLDEKVETDSEPAKGKYVFGMVKVGERGQVVIPKHAREVYDIKAGDKLLVVGDENGMAFAKVKSLPDFYFGG